MNTRRVVVTGMGMLTPLGNNVEESWKNAVSGASGAAPIESFDTTGFAVRFSASVKGFDPSIYMDAKEARRMDPFVQFGMAAGIQAIEDAGVDKAGSVDLSRVGVSMGSGIGGIQTIAKTHETLIKSGPRRVSPFFVPSSIINMISGNLSIKYGYRGPNIAIVTACTTGTHNIGYAGRMIRDNDADVVVAGGSEMATTPVTVAGFSSMKALSSRNDDPTAASRPWDRDRDGFVLGDGAGAVVLEEYEHAKARGATIYAELIGFGMSADAYHITSPPDDGAGGVASMANALKDAGVSPSDVQYINAHGTSTPQGDLVENRAIKQVFGENTTAVVNSTKSMTGHLLGAAGAIEAIFTILAIHRQISPPTINLENPGEGCDLDYVANVARKMSIQTAISNSFGFGGTNGTLVFRSI